MEDFQIDSRLIHMLLAALNEFPPIHFGRIAPAEQEVL
jgi:hypothetical protein